VNKIDVPGIHETIECVPIRRNILRFLKLMHAFAVKEVTQALSGGDEAKDFIGAHPL